MNYYEYQQEIKEIAESVKEEVREHGGDVYDRIHETVDGHQWVIYTNNHYPVLAASNNADYGIEEGLIDARESAKNGQLSMHQAYWAMVADVQDEIGNWSPADEECGYCGKAIADDDERAEHEETCCEDDEPEENAGVDADPGL